MVLCVQGIDRCSGGLRPKSGNVLPAPTIGTFLRVKEGTWGADLPIAPPGILRFPKEKQWFCVFKGSIAARAD